MWRLAERFGNDIRHIADYRSEQEAAALYRDLSQHPSRAFVCYPTEGRFESPHLWRVWAIGRTTGVPDTLLLAAATRAFAEAYITDRRPVGEDWRLFYLEPNGDQVTVLPGVPATPPPPPPRPYYHAVRALGASGFDVVATFDSQAAAQHYIDERPDQGLSLVRTAGLAPDAVVQPVSLARPAPPPVPEPPPEPKIRRRAVRL